PGERGRWPWTGPGAGRRSPQASARTPANTRESARSGKKKGQQRTVDLLVLVEAAGIEPASASPTFRALHAYSVFVLAAGYPTDREDPQPARKGFSGSDPGPVLAAISCG